MNLVIWRRQLYWEYDEGETQWEAGGGADVSHSMCARSTSHRGQSSVHKTGLQDSAALSVDRAHKKYTTLVPPRTSHCGRWQECPEQEHHLMYNWSVVTVASRAVFLLFICSPSPSPPHSLGHGAHSLELEMSSSCLCWGQCLHLHECSLKLAS